MSKKILLLVSSLGSGGAERVATNLSNAWVSAGNRVTLVVTYFGRGECFYSLTPAVGLRYLADEATGTRHLGKNYLARFLALRRMVIQENPDVVVSFLPNVNVAAVLATLGMRLPVIVCEHNYPPQDPVGQLWSRLRRWTYPLASRVTMLTSEGLDWLRDEIPSARGCVMPNPIHYPLPVGVPQLHTQALIPPARKMLLAIGRMVEQKGFDGLISSFASIASQQPAWDLVILGDGPLRSTLAQQVQALGLDSRVLMPGRAGNVGAWYEHADLYVLSSRYEGFPLTLGEAMAHGCAAVSFDCDTGPRDLIRHEVDGLLVPPGDVGALTLALERLMQDDALRAQMAERALEVRNRYSMRRVLALWDDLFVDVCKQRKIIQ